MAGAFEVAVVDRAGVGERRRRSGRGRGADRAAGRARRACRRAIPGRRAAAAARRARPARPRVSGLGSGRRRRRTGRHRCGRGRGRAGRRARRARSLMARRRDGALGDVPVEQAGVGQHVERRAWRPGVSPARLSASRGEPARLGDVAAAEGAPRGRGEQDGAARMVGGEPVEEELGPEERLVDEPALRVQVEVRRQLGGELEVVSGGPPVRRAQLGEDRREPRVRACFLDGAELQRRRPWRRATNHSRVAARPSPRRARRRRGGRPAKERIGLEQMEPRRRAGRGRR